MEKEEEGFQPIDLEKKEVEVELEAAEEPAKPEPEPAAPTEPKSEDKKDSRYNKRIRELVARNKQAEERAAKAEEALKAATGQVLTTQEAALTNSQKSLNDQLGLLKKQHEEAMERGDAKAVTEILDLMMDRKAQLQYVNIQLAQVNQRKAQPVVEPKPEKTRAEVDEIPEPIQNFIERNPWFRKDKVMTAAAVAINNELLEQGMDVNDEALYEQVEARIREEFPHKFQTEKPVTRSAPVASRPVSSGKVKVVLTQRDQEVARKLGISTEEYARQKARTPDTNGYYEV